VGKGAPSRRAHAWARFALPTLRISAPRDSISSGYALVGAELKDQTAIDMVKAQLAGFEKLIRMVKGT
jgi:hypothetical protein